MIPVGRFDRLRRDLIGLQRRGSCLERRVHLPGGEAVSVRVLRHAGVFVICLCKTVKLRQQLLSVVDRAQPLDDALCARVLLRLHVVREGGVVFIHGGKQDVPHREIAVLRDIVLQLLV